MCADQAVNPTAPHRIASAQVREASEAALAAVLQTITAPELLKIMTRIHAAHLQPHADAEALINDLLEVSRLASSQRPRHSNHCVPVSFAACSLPLQVTFVNGVDPSGLAVLIPLIARALKHRSIDLVKKASKCCKNICSLVADYEAMLAFLPMLMPEIEKLLDHSHPEVRAAAEAAKKSLEESSREYEEANAAAPSLEKARSLELAERAKLNVTTSPNLNLASPHTPFANSAVAAQVEKALSKTDKLLDEEVVPPSTWGLCVTEKATDACFRHTQAPQHSTLRAFHHLSTADTL